jgi:uroporphyrinogen-III synthase
MPFWPAVRRTSWRNSPAPPEPVHILLCRARHEGEATARKLREAGHVPILAPVLAFVRLAATLPEGRPDALLITSARAADVLTDTEAERLRDRPVFAVGPGTAAAMRLRGFRDVRVGQGDAAMLLPLVALTLPAPAHLLYLAGRVRKTDLPAALDQQGYRVSTVEVYDVGPAPPWDETVLEDLRRGVVSACLHYSRHSAERALAAAAAGGVMQPFLGLEHLCISADAAAPLVRAAADRIRIAEELNEASLLRCMASA